MQWLSAPRLADILKSVMPPAVAPIEEEDDAPNLPWTLASRPDEGSAELQRELRERMLDLHNHPELFHRDSPEARGFDLSGTLAVTAGAVLEVDSGLRQLRFRIVPRLVSEARFWGRYFAACADIRRQVLPAADEACPDACANLALEGDAAPVQDAAEPPAAADAVALGPSAAGGRDPAAAGAAVSPPGSQAAGRAVPPIAAAARPPSRPRSAASSDAGGPATAPAAAAQWPILVGSSFRGAAPGYAVHAWASPGAGPQRPQAASPRPRRFLLGSGSAAPAPAAATAEVTGGDLGGAAAAESSLSSPFALYAWPTGPTGSALGGPSSRSASLYSGGPSSARGGMSRQHSCATISSDGGYSDWSHISDQFGPMGRELSAATATWLLVDRV